MDKKLQELKKQIVKIKRKNPKTKYYPKSFWDGVFALSSSYKITELAAHLGISANNLKRQLQKNNKGEMESSLAPSLVQIPQLIPTEKVVLELTTPSGAIIKVFS